MKPANTFLFTLGVLLAGGPSVPSQEAKPSPEEVRFFESKVRPLLVEHCQRCHGAEKQKGHLRLDSLTAMLAGGDQGPALVVGVPEKSLIIKAVSYAVPELKMPPSQKLTSEQIGDLAKWIKLGAPWPGGDKVVVVPKKGEMQVTAKDREHWAFQAIKRLEPPQVKKADWVRNPIDAFILAKLESKGLEPNPPAPPQQLVRRLYYDLTGLAPTPAEVEAFLADKNPRAYENLVDRLLASPRHGEKWARHWLDLVRYAETNSYERDNPKPHAWRYRDYVIRAFNDDKPFDRFVREQLAGDEMPGVNADSLIATGYYRLGIWDDEPVDRVLARYDGLDDIIATTTQVFLGLTMDCARCHDHKIDPIPQKDYYRLLAFFHNINHFRNGGPTDEVAIDNSPEIEKANLAIEKRKNEILAALADFEKEVRTAFEQRGKGPAQASDMEDLKYRFYRDSWMKLPDFAVLKFEDEGKLPRGYFDIAPRTRNEAFGFVFEGSLIVPRAGKYTFFLDSDDGSRLTVAGKKLLEYDGIHGLGKEKSATLDLAPGRLPIKLEYFQNVFGLGLAVAWSGPGFERRLLSTPLEGKSFGKELGQIIASEGPRILGPRFAQYQSLKKELDVLKKQKPAGQLALCVTEAGRQAPDTFVFLRGNPGAKGPQVEPGFPQVLTDQKPSLPVLPQGVKSTGRRTALADWLTSPANQLTPRVMVNRLWQHHFGRGIVRSPNDFGFQGTRPTHPELLDWLASEFVARGWSMKEMHRLIVTSNAYKMSSQGNPRALAMDPTNDLLWRFDMRRLSAEEIRDSILAVSGNLSLKMYGPGVFPEIPAQVLAGQSVPGRGWGKSSPEDQNRRSVYIHVKRSLLHPILESFDLAETDRSTPVRFATTQPTQALSMLNGDFLNKQAGIFAERLKQEAGAKTADQVRLALALATSRQPSAEEVRRGVGLIEAMQAQQVSSEQSLRLFCLMVLNLNEFAYLD